MFLHSKTAILIVYCTGTRNAMFEVQNGEGGGGKWKFRKNKQQNQMMSPLPPHGCLSDFVLADIAIFLKAKEVKWWRKVNEVVYDVWIERGKRELRESASVVL